MRRIGRTRSRALFGTAEQWLREQGMRRVRGPFSLSINEETGLLIEGFDTPPVFMMGHARPYYARARRGAGLPEGGRHIRLQDQGPISSRRPSWRGSSPPREKRVRVRPLDRKRFDDEIALLRDIFNDAWAQNWGFVPFTAAEFHELGQESALSRRSGTDSDRRGRRRARRVHGRHPQHQRGDPRARRPALAVRLGEAPVATQGAPSDHRPRAADGRATQISAHAPRSRARVPRDRRRAAEDAGSSASRTSSCPGSSRTTRACAASSSRSAATPTSAIASTSGNSMEPETYRPCAREH